MKDLNFTILRKDNIDSTQLYLKCLIKDSELAEGTVVITDTQHSGIGQEGNHWESLPGKNLTFSIVIYPVNIQAGDQFLLNKMISLAVLKCLMQIREIKTALSVKWPNDIYIGNKKTGGILITHAVMGDTLKNSIIGIGLNINQDRFSSYCPNPTSLYLETGKEFLVEDVLQSLLQYFKRYYSMTESNREAIDAEYLQHLYQRNQWCSYVIKGKKETAMITGVNEYGWLRLEVRGRGLTECDLKEIIYL